MRKPCGPWEAGGVRLIKVPRLEVEVEVEDGMVGLHAIAL